MNGSYPRGKSCFKNKCLKRGLERVKGIEPSYSAWEAAALPLSYTRVDIRVNQREAEVKMLAQAHLGQSIGKF